MSIFKTKLYVDISEEFDEAEGELSGLEHTYFSCRDNDNRPQNAYYNGCPRCVKIACAIADRAILDCDVVLIKE